MKPRVLFFLLLLVTLFVIISQDRVAQNTMLELINPVKQNYKRFTQKLENRSKTYIFQKESIKKLTKENKVLKKYLLDQTHYLQQVNSLFKKIPSLEKLPYKSVTIVDTISYVKLNAFSEVLLTTPKSSTPIEEGKAYGLIQNNTIGGTAVMKNGNLYGYLTSNSRCRFAVFIGKNRTPGITQGLDKDRMLIKFIPKWADIKVGDKVESSGLDDIFFTNIPVGTIESIKIENRYKIAYVKTYSDTLHPDFFFLITDTKPRLTSNYDQNTTLLDTLEKDRNVSSIPKMLQTKESEIDITEYETPKEKIVTKAPVKKKEPVEKEITSKKPKIKKKVNVEPRPVAKPKPVSKPKPVAKPVKKVRNPLDIFKQ